MMKRNILFYIIVALALVAFILMKVSMYDYRLKNISNQDEREFMVVEDSISIIDKFKSGFDDKLNELEDIFNNSKGNNTRDKNKNKSDSSVFDNAKNKLDDLIKSISKFKFEDLF